MSPSKCKSKTSICRYSLAVRRLLRHTLPSRLSQIIKMMSSSMWQMPAVRWALRPHYYLRIKRQTLWRTYALNIPKYASVSPIVSQKARSLATSSPSPKALNMTGIITYRLYQTLRGRLSLMIIHLRIYCRTLTGRRFLFRGAWWVNIQKSLMMRWSAQKPKIYLPMPMR